MNLSRRARALILVVLVSTLGLAGCAKKDTAPAISGVPASPSTTTAG